MCGVTDGSAIPPASREHLGAAVGHAASAGRELLAALQAASARPQPAAGGPDAGHEAAGPDRPAPTGGAGPQRVRIPVDEQEDTA